MNKSLPSLKSRMAHWDCVYSRQGQRWGTTPSLCAHLALAEIGKHARSSVTVLDVGCGYARDLALFGRVFNKAMLTGLDACERAIEMGRQLVPGASLVHCDLFQLRACRIDSHFDVVFANYFLHLLFDDEIFEALRMLRALLADGGRTVLSFVSIDDRHYGKSRRLGYRTYEVAAGAPWRFVDVEEVCTFCERAGLVVLGIKAFSEVELVLDRPDRVEGIYVVATKSPS